MSGIRQVTETVAAQPVLEGADVRLHRVFGHAELTRFEPFLLLDDFRGDEPALLNGVSPCIRTAACMRRVVPLLSMTASGLAPLPSIFPTSARSPFLAASSKARVSFSWFIRLPPDFSGF